MYPFSLPLSHSILPLEAMTNFHSREQQGVFPVSRAPSINAWLLPSRLGAVFL